MSELQHEPGSHAKIPRQIRAISTIGRRVDLMQVPDHILSAATQRLVESLRTGGLTPQEGAELEGWLEADSQHRAVYEQLRSTLDRLGITSRTKRQAKPSTHSRTPVPINGTKDGSTPKT
jgi:ferric-dicitrate binding protein FerR (iron transport regulator)